MAEAGCGAAAAGVTPAAEASALRTRRRRRVTLAAGAIVSAATTRVADPLLPQVAEEFHVGPGSASVIVTAFALSYGLCQIAYGPLGDRLGKVRVTAVTLLLASFAVALSSLADSLATLGLLRFLGGAFAAAVIPLSFAYIGDVIRYEERQATLARFLSGQILGVIFGQVFGGALGEAIGWRGLFLLLGGCYFVVALLLFRALPADEKRTVGHRNPFAEYIIVLAVPWARTLLLAVFIEGMCFFGGLAYIGALLRERFALGFVVIGAVLGCFGLGGLLYTFVVKIVLRRLGERGMAASGGIGLLLSFAAIAAAPAWWLLPSAVVGVGFFYYMLHNTLQTHATQMAPSARGTSIAAFAFCFFFGQALGVAAAGAAIERIGYAPVLVTVGAGLCLLGLWVRQRLARHAAA
jgi:YNFM family putative membrane transporter